MENNKPVLPPSPVSRQVSPKHVLMVIVVICALVAVGYLASPRIAVLLASLLAMAGFYAYDRRNRLGWEAEMTRTIQGMRMEYERLARDNARNRTEFLSLKKKLADTGAMARSYKRLPEDEAEERMLRVIIEQFSSLKDSKIDFSAFPKGDPAAGTKVEDLNETQIRALLHLAIDRDGIDLIMQPIVTLPHRKNRFYELFSRIRVRQGEYLSASQYMPIATSENLLSAIDNLLLLSCLRFLRDVEQSSDARSYFCNITSNTLSDPKFMGDLIEFIAHHRNMAPRLVFEFSQKDLAEMTPDTLQVMHGLAQLGCKFSMDTVTSLGFNMQYIESRHIRFIKVSADILLRVIDEGGLPRLRRFKQELDQIGVDIIVERIESERQVTELLEIGVRFGQGYLFGRPSEAKFST